MNATGNDNKTQEATFWVVGKFPKMATEFSRFYYCEDRRDAFVRATKANGTKIIATGTN